MSADRTLEQEDVIRLVGLSALAPLAVALRHSEVIQYLPRAPYESGLTRIRWELPGHDFQVEVQPTNIEHGRGEVRDAFILGLRHVWRLADYATATENLKAATERARLQAQRAERRMEQVCGQRPAGDAMGPCEVRPDPTSGEGWAGRVWLLDPDKRWAGFSFWFRTLADLWRAHPYLRPVAAGTDEAGPWMRVEAFTLAPPPEAP